MKEKLVDRIEQEYGVALAMSNRLPGGKDISEKSLFYWNGRAWALADLLISMGRKLDRIPWVRTAD